MPIIIFLTAKDHSCELYLAADRLWSEPATLMLDSLEQYKNETDWKHVGLGREVNKLFQTERCAFGRDQAARLASTFKKWKELLVTSKWDVGREWHHICWG